MMEFISKVVSVLYCRLYPVFLTYQTLKAAGRPEGDKEYNARVRSCLVYWTIYAVVLITGPLADCLQNLLPLYFLWKTAFLIWLAAPPWKGAAELFSKYLDPIVSEREQYIDDGLTYLRTRAVHDLTRRSLDLFYEAAGKTRWKLKAKTPLIGSVGCVQFSTDGAESELVKSKTTDACGNEDALTKISTKKAKGTSDERETGSEDGDDVLLKRDSRIKEEELMVNEKEEADLFVEREARQPPKNLDQETSAVEEGIHVLNATNDNNNREHAEGLSEEKHYVDPELAVGKTPERLSQLTNGKMQAIKENGADTTKGEVAELAQDGGKTQEIANEQVQEPQIFLTQGKVQEGCSMNTGVKEIQHQGEYTGPGILQKDTNNGNGDGGTSERLDKDGMQEHGCTLLRQDNCGESEDTRKRHEKRPLEPNNAEQNDQINTPTVRQEIRSKQTLDEEISNENEESRHCDHLELTNQRRHDSQEASLLEGRAVVEDNGNNELPVEEGNCELSEEDIFSDVESSVKPSGKPGENALIKPSTADEENEQIHMLMKPQQLGSLQEGSCTSFDQNINSEEEPLQHDGLYVTEGHGNDSIKERTVVPEEQGVREDIENEELQVKEGDYRKSKANGFSLQQEILILEQPESKELLKPGSDGGRYAKSDVFPKTQEISITQERRCTSFEQHGDDDDKELHNGNGDGDTSKRFDVDGMQEHGCTLLRRDICGGIEDTRRRHEEERPLKADSADKQNDQNDQKDTPTERQDISGRQAPYKDISNEDKESRHCDHLGLKNKQRADSKGEASMPDGRAKIERNENTGLQIGEGSCKLSEEDISLLKSDVESSAKPPGQREESALLKPSIIDRDNGKTDMLTEPRTESFADGKLNNEARGEQEEKIFKLTEGAGLPEIQQVDMGELECNKCSEAEGFSLKQTIDFEELEYEDGYEGKWVEGTPVQDNWITEGMPHEQAQQEERICESSEERGMTTDEICDGYKPSDQETTPERQNAKDRIDEDQQENGNGWIDQNLVVSDGEEKLLVEAKTYNDGIAKKPSGYKQLRNDHQDEPEQETKSDDEKESMVVEKGSSGMVANNITTDPVVNQELAYDGELTRVPERLQKSASGCEFSVETYRKNVGENSLGKHDSHDERKKLLLLEEERNDSQLESDEYEQSAYDEYKNEPENEERSGNGEKTFMSPGRRELPANQEYDMLDEEQMEEEQLMEDDGWIWQDDGEEPIRELEPIQDSVAFVEQSALVGESCIKEQEEVSEWITHNDGQNWPLLEPASKQSMECNHEGGQEKSETAVNEGSLLVEYVPGDPDIYKELDGRQMEDRQMEDRQVEDEELEEGELVDDGSLSWKDEGGPTQAITPPKEILRGDVDQNVLLGDSFAKKENAFAKKENGTPPAEQGSCEEGWSQAHADNEGRYSDQEGYDESEHEREDRITADSNIGEDILLGRDSRREKMMKAGSHIGSAEEESPLWKEFGRLKIDDNSGLQRAGSSVHSHLSDNLENGHLMAATICGNPVEEVLWGGEGSSPPQTHISAGLHVKTEEEGLYIGEKVDVQEWSLNPNSKISKEQEHPTAGNESDAKERAEQSQPTQQSASGESVDDEFSDEIDSDDGRPKFTRVNRARLKYNRKRRGNCRKGYKKEVTLEPALLGRLDEEKRGLERGIEGPTSVEGISTSESGIHEQDCGDTKQLGDFLLEGKHHTKDKDSSLHQTVEMGARMR